VIGRLFGANNRPKHYRCTCRQYMYRHWLWLCVMKRYRCLRSILYGCLLTSSCQA